jgi:hypothetical protein
LPAMRPSFMRNPARRLCSAVGQSEGFGATAHKLPEGATIVAQGGVRKCGRNPGYKARRAKQPRRGDRSCLRKLRYDTVQPCHTPIVVRCFIASSPPRSGAR